MRILSALAVLLCVLYPGKVDAAGTLPVQASGGEISFTFYRGNLQSAGLLMLGTYAVDSQTDAASLAISPHSNLDLDISDGFFEALAGGKLSMGAGLKVMAAGEQLSSENAQLVPKTSTRDTLWLTDAGGKHWFYLDYGHFEQQGQTLHGRYMDVRIAGDLAEMMGKPALKGYLVGAANLETRIKNPSAQPASQQSLQTNGISSFCPVISPNWPNQGGYEADIAMLKMDEVSEVARLGGRVAIVPTAYFENIGTADVPWFAQFADTREVDACCADQGNGACAPYGNDQGGLLVYHLYRYLDGRLEQLGQSQVKHAFNSINTDSNAGSVACRATNRSGRVVPSGCEDLYQAYSNAHQSYLGPRDEIIAHQVIWLRDGSIWDKTGPMDVPDGNCDYLPGVQQFGGQVPCLAPVEDALERRLSVAESDLLVPGARYFMEAWYLVRDDINVFNSFGRKEIAPELDGAWTFPAASAFAQGPVIDDYLALQNDDASAHAQTIAASQVDVVDTGEGHLQLATTVVKISEAQWRYDFALMNIDFDRAIDGFDIPIPAGVSVLETDFFDGDAELANDWTISFPAGLVRFEAPDGVSLKWGSLVSFRMLADRAPAEAQAELKVAVAGAPQNLSIQSLSGVPLIFEDGFEE